MTPPTTTTTPKPNTFLLRNLGIGAVSLSIPTFAFYYYYHNPNNKTSRTGVETDKTCNLLRLPTPSQAQEVKLLHTNKLLNESQRAHILKSASKARSNGSVAYVERSGRSGRWQLGGDWRTTYLHTNHFMDTVIDTEEFMERCLSEVEQRAKDQDEGWKMMQDFLYHHDENENDSDDDYSKKRRRRNFRTMELHEYRTGGGLPARKHYDAGSIITIDILLSDQFTGGDLYCPVYSDIDNSDISKKEYSNEHGNFSKAGDGVMFPSHKFHNVEPVQSGKRVVLVCEIWDGDKKSCAHRCLQNDDDSDDGKECDYDLEEHLKRQTVGMYALL